MVTPNVIDALPGSSSGGGGPSAATLVVSLTPGEGDYTTIQDALDNLPAEGGYILVREGTYTLAAPLTMPDKSVVIRGCGRNSTIITIDANAIPAVDIPDSYNVENAYVFEDLSLRGQVVAGQYAFQVATEFFTPINVNRCIIDGFQSIVNVVGGIAGVFSFKDSQDILLGSGALMLGSSSSGNITMSNCLFFFDGSEAIALNGSPSLQLYESAFNCLGAEAGVRFQCGQFSDVVASSIVGAEFEVSHNSKIIGSRFNFSRLELVGNGCTVVGDLFESAAQGIVIPSSDNTVVGCVFESSVTDPITETGSDDKQNVYDGNQGYGTTSVFIGTGSKVEGSKCSTADVTSANAYATLLTHRNPMGLIGIGTIKNVGANDVTVRETVTDRYGVTDSVETVVAPGDFYPLDIQTTFDTAQPPYISYQVEVKSTVTDDHSDVETRFSSNALVEV